MGCLSGHAADGVRVVGPAGIVVSFAWTSIKTLPHDNASITIE
ncbi:MAG: hypothetical protein K0S21_545 [Rhizobiaceae bacterium]|nr:hypothetical protein [Rhizobiaceae bacterium]